jgi:hypothetical protein
MNEVWKPIVGHEGSYKVSNLGRVLSMRSGVLRPQVNNHGYLYVYLKYGGRGKTYIHRLVAEAFVHNSNHDVNTVVNHIDFNPTNNRADNLEWTTDKGNVRHSINAGRYERTDEWLAHLRETNEKNGMSVIGRNLLTGDEITFKCLNDCRDAGFQPSCVCNCCQGKRKSHKGYTWRYSDA